MWRGKRPALAAGPFLIALVALLAITVAHAAFDVPRAELSVVRIVAETRTGYGTGTGFVLNTDGHVATNHHVIEGAESVKVLFSGSDNPVPANVVWKSAGLDLAVLKVRQAGAQYHPVTIATAETRKGMKVYAMGYPGLADDKEVATDSTLTDGIIGRLFRATWGGGGPELSIIQHSAPINPGNSGGPLFDACGRVVGVNTQASRAGRIIRNQDGEVVEVMAGQGVLFASGIGELARELGRESIGYAGDNTVCAGAANGEAASAAEEAASAAEEAASAAGEAVSTAEEAASAAGEAVSTAEQTASAVTRWGAVLAVLTLLTFLLALRKPRERIVRVVEGYSRKLSRRSPALQPRDGPPPAARGGKVSRGLLLAGFSGAGHPLRVVIEADALNTARAGVSVGRGDALVDIPVKDAQVSRRHVRFSAVNGGVMMEDLNSSNGTRLNGQIVKPFQPAAVRPGDTVNLGSLEFNVS